MQRAPLADALYAPLRCEVAVAGDVLVQRFKAATQVPAGGATDPRLEAEDQPKDKPRSALRSRDGLPSSS